MKLWYVSLPWLCLTLRKCLKIKAKKQLSTIHTVSLICEHWGAKSCSTKMPHDEILRSLITSQRVVKLFFFSWHFFDMSMIPNVIPDQILYCISRHAASYRLVNFRHVKIILFFSFLSEQKHQNYCNTEF